jgi:hypothetical protein
MADGDDLEIGTNNQAQSMTQLVLGLSNPSTTLLKVGTGGGAGIGVHGIGGTGLKGEGGSSGAGVHGEGGIGIKGNGGSIGVHGVGQTGIKGEGGIIGVEGAGKGQGVWGSSDKGIGMESSAHPTQYRRPWE